MVFRAEVGTSKGQCTKVTSMSKPLDGAIDGLLNQSISLPDVLRSLLVVTRRIEAVEVTRWIYNELNGYDIKSDVPNYRVLAAPVIELKFDGPYQSRRTITLSSLELHKSLRLPEVKMRQPIAELAELALLEEKTGISLPGYWVQNYRNLADQGKASTMAGMILNDGSIIIPKTFIVGIIDRIRTSALNLALDFEQVSKEAGTATGPTIEQLPGLATASSSFISSIYSSPGSEAF